MITLQDLTKRFGALVAVNGVSLRVEPGEIFGLLGPNGAGKSTTVHMTVGLLSPDAGRVDIAGLGSPTDPDVRRAIGVAPQALALYDELTAEENLAFFGRMYGLEGRALRDRVDDGLRAAGLDDRRRDRVVVYSGGMKRRLNLSAALLHDPRVVLLDEPTAGVDPQSRHAIFERVASLRARGCAVIYTTHYMEEAVRLCDRVGIMDHGRLLALDTVPNLVAEHGGDPTLVVRADGEDLRVTTHDPLGELTRIAQQRRVDDFRVERGTLEHVFLNLTGRALRD